MTVRVPKDSLRDQLALAAGAKINLGFDLELLTIALEWERAEHEAERAVERNVHVRHQMAVAGSHRAELAEARKEGRVLAWYAWTIGAVVGVFIGRLAWPF